MSRVFERFAPFIQDYIYKNGWQELKEVQLGAAEVLFNTENNLLLTSPTASGKTEAALFPVLTRLAEEEINSFGALYIAPLKSLINDQFSRLEELLDMSGIPVFHWHGDVGASHKSKALRDPRGILQITPESLESMLINRPNDIVRLFCRLKYIILDEIHTLTGSDRGSQILCQMARISRAIGSDPVRIGLSATLGDPSVAARWLSSGSSRQTSIVGQSESRTVWRLGMEHFYILSSPSGDNGPLPSADAGAEYIYDCTKGKKCLVFANSREETEYLTATLRQIAEKRGEEDVFTIHHGNLSSSIREEAEARLKDDELRTVTCATVTLELGIDVGRLERIVQLDSPLSVSSMLQRLGRSGRRGDPPEMMTVFREEDPLPNTPLPQLIPWDLLRAIAITQLYIEERFIEPPSVKKLPLSLLFQQSLSMLASCGELSPKELAKRVLTLPPFDQVEAEEYRELLISMLKNGFIEMSEEKTLLIGEKGERLINSFKFYAVFKDSEDFTVRDGSGEIGTITTPPPVGDRFALAGRVWEVEEADLQRRLIYVKQVKGKMEISWPGEGAEIHTRILERMKQVLEEDTIYPYLKKNAIARLEEARRVARNSGMLQSSLVSLGGYTKCLFPWLGTRAFRALRRLIASSSSRFGISGLEYGGCYYMTFKAEREGDLIAYLDSLFKSGELLDGMLVSQSEAPVFEKYDEYIPSELLRRAYLCDRLNIDEVRDRINMIAKE